MRFHHGSFSVSGRMFPANEILANYAGEQVTVHGKVMERDGQRFIAISHIE